MYSREKYLSDKKKKPSGATESLRGNPDFVG
jgi:hypothetical protein